ncbi:2',5'-phosphodiesterase, partial [Paragonimus westermani]
FVGSSFRRSYISRSRLLAIPLQHLLGQSYVVQGIFTTYLKHSLPNVLPVSTYRWAPVCTYRRTVPSFNCWQTGRSYSDSAFYSKDGRSQQMAHHDQATITNLADTTDLKPFYVYRSENDGVVQVCVEFQLQSPDGSLSYFQFKRPAVEQLSTFLSSIVTKVNNTFARKSGKQTKRNNQPSIHLSVTGVSLLRQIAEKLSHPRYIKVDQNNGLSDTLLADALCSVTELDSFFLQFDFSALKPVILQMVRNPARVKKCVLNTVPMVGCPVVPAIELENASLTNCEFVWFVSESKEWPSDPCHFGFVFTPRSEHLGCRVRLAVCPRDETGRIGLVRSRLTSELMVDCPVTCAWPVRAEPQQNFHMERYTFVQIILYALVFTVNDRWYGSVIWPTLIYVRLLNRFRATEKPVTNNGFRVVSYNILAAHYACSDSARNQIFRHCPLENLDQSYRLPLILRELFAYRADLICLQEVDAGVFQHYLKPAMKCHLNMEGIYVGKRRLRESGDPPEFKVSLHEEKAEGCVIFYRPSHFELVRECHLPSILSHAAQDPYVSKILKRIQAGDKTYSNEQKSCPDIFRSNFKEDGQKAQAHCLAAVLFRARQSSNDAVSDRLIVVGCTHFYFSPAANCWRYIQACTVRQHLNAIAVKAHTEFKLPVSILFCGDINQTPEGPAYTALLEEAEGERIPSRSLLLSSAYPVDADAFTNWVPGFSAALDVILYSAQSGLTCSRALPLCSKETIATQLKEQCSDDTLVIRGEPVAELDKYALPNAQFPSDHLALVAEFTWANEDS